jgi:hypothetical protein
VTVVDSLPPNTESGEGDHDFDHDFERAVDAVFARWGGDH